MQRWWILAFVLVIIILNCVADRVLAGQNETMVVEANIFADPVLEDVISIEVPDYVFLGNVSRGEKTEKIRINVNNTGTVNITVTPELNNPLDKIFSNIYCQSRQTGNYSTIYKIGSYSFDIEAPSSLGGKRSEYFYMWLNLTDYEESIPNDMIGEREQITFVALPKD